MTANVAAGKTILEAIRNEIQGRALYLAIAAKVKNPLVRRKLLGLADDELTHRETLSRLYWSQTGTEPGDVDTSAAQSAVPDVTNMTLAAALALAMKEEKQASERYARMAVEAKDSKTRAFLEYLGDFEAGHYETLKAELETIAKNPGWHDQKDPTCS